MTRLAVAALVVTGLLAAGCGVSAQDEPVPLETSSVFPEPMPTVTERSDRPSTSSTSPTPTSSPPRTTQAADE